MGTRTTTSKDASNRPGFTLTTLFGMGLGVVCGMVLSEMLGDLHHDRVRGAVRRIRTGRSGRDDIEPEQVQRNILSALRGNPTTRQSDINVRALGDGLVELTGTVPDDRARGIARDLAVAAAGADVVVNRILVEGRDIEEESSLRLRKDS